MQLLGLEFADLDAAEAADLLARRAVSAPFGYVTTPNADHLVRLHRRQELLALYQGAMLRLLQHGFGAGGLDHCGHLFRLVPDDDDGFLGSQRRTGAQNLFDQRAAARTVQHLREAGFQARAFSRSHNGDGDAGG